ncbi:hypothetical protein H310_09524 [Aphanomyces invadans]|uniref:Roadblock/LAMTOR2 domain-containing protein n=1 Tax=Aphanomyces invadans TaxID=157072 RepID=A0A024TUC7_9STRA|nr:hypothetical protein H310_09524 [Aphanomyces invadans]ETV97633.1 hypothetical protein H310_09524 [Aphanomyces invadans]|eukprot:XP_008873842.1 hypothetical protein H310_09524 [Aphanomyces invadans]
MIEADDMAWAMLVKDLKADQGHGPLCAGIVIYDPRGNVVYEEGWFREETSFEAKAAMFAVLADVVLARTHRIDLDGHVFHVVENVYGNLCAVGRRRKMGLISQRFPSGILVAVFRYPYSLQTAVPVVAKLGRRLRS